MHWFLWAIVALVFWGMAPVFGKLGLQNVDPLAALTVRTTGVTAAVILVAAFSGKLTSLSAVGFGNVALLLGEGIFASVLGHYAYFYALKTGNTTGVVPVAAAYPVLTAVLGWLLLRESMTPGRAAGIALVIAGVFLIRRF